MKSEESLTDSWDFTREDEQPGLDAQVTRWMRGKQLETLGPARRREIERRLERRAFGQDDD